MYRKTTAELICENFKLPRQTIFQDYKCSLRSGILYFGRLYVGESHVLFVSNMFSIVKKIVITIQDIIQLEEKGQNSILVLFKDTVNKKDKEFLFTGFENNHPYTLIRALWKKEKIQPEVLALNEEEKIEQQSSKSLQNENSQIQANFFEPEAVETEKLKIAQFQIPTSVQQYYSYFLADNASLYSRKKHLEFRNAQKIIIGPWRQSQELSSQVRQVSAVIKLTGVPFLSRSHINQVWLMKKKQGQIKVSISNEVKDIPYSSYFNCEQYITILADGDKCRMIVEACVVFTKSTYMKNKILARSYNDFKEDNEIWINNVKQYLKGKSRKKSNEIAQDQINFPKNKQIQYERNMSEIQNIGVQKNKSQKMQIQIDKLIEKVHWLGNLIAILLIISIIQLFK